MAGKYDITAGDYVTYIEDQLGADGAPQHDLRIVAEASFLQPNVLTVLVKGGSQISQVGQLKGKNVSVNAPNDIGTLLINSLLVSHGLTPRQIHYTTVPFPGVATALTARIPRSPRRSPPSRSSAPARPRPACRSSPTSTRARPRTSRSRATRSRRTGRRSTPTR